MIFAYPSTPSLFWQQWQWYHQEWSNTLTGTDLSSISAPPMAISTVDNWETYSDVDNFSSDEPRRISLTSSPSPPPPPTKQKRKLRIRMSFPKSRGVSQHVCGACLQVLSERKNMPGTSRDQLKLNETIDYSIFLYIFMLRLYINSRSCNWYVWYTSHSRVLIWIGTEPLRNKRIFPFFF